MLIPEWSLTPEISDLLAEISALNIVFNKYHPQPELLSSFTRQSVLNSAVYSARIENIPARIDDPQVANKKEVQNLVTAYNYVLSSRSPQNLTQSLIRKLHQLVLHSIGASAGHWRGEPWAIFNSEGIAIYLAPAHFTLPTLMSEYITYIHSLKDPAPIVAAIAQFSFEKIHPFADGNGRVGRLISTFVLAKAGFSAVSEFEKYLDDHRDEYYEALEPNQNCTQFITYFLTSLVVSGRHRLDMMKNPPNVGSQSVLLPRRQELISILRDHPQSSFDFLVRRFPNINPKTLHYDLLQLQKSGLVVKHGVSRGSLYSSNS